MTRKSVYMGTTEISTQKTIGQITELLVGVMASRVATDYKNGKVAAVCFTLTVPGIPDPVNFRLPCRTEVLLRLCGGNSAQAERTSWRQVLRWVEAQIAMIEVGLVKPHEVFQPYAMIPGTEKTMFQAWEENMQGRMIAAPVQR